MNWPRPLLNVSNLPQSVSCSWRGIDTFSLTGLRKAVAIPSVSADDDKRPEVVRVRAQHPATATGSKQQD